MVMIWKSLKISFFVMITIGLLFSSALFSVLLYGKITGKEWANFDDGLHESIAHAESQDNWQIRLSVSERMEDDVENPASLEETNSVVKLSAMLDAPIYQQYPELYNGCEVTSLAMLLNYYGIEKSKLDLAPELENDPTPVQLAKDGTILYWGNPNTGFVGDVYGKSMGFGIFHGALLKLMEQYIPSSVDLTGESFQAIEKQISDGFPVIIWTTNDFRVPSYWIEWDTPIGPIRTTMKEHAVLMVGYDEKYVYVNDPMSGKAKAAVEKEAFIAAWVAMGKQALSYIEPKQMEGEH